MPTIERTEKEAKHETRRVQRVEGSEYEGERGEGLNHVEINVELSVTMQ